MAKAGEKERKRLAFPRRITVTLDEDAQKLANFAAQRSAWVSQSHFVNAVIRKVMAAFAPPELQPRVDHFEQLALAKPLKLKE